MPTHPTCPFDPLRSDLVVEGRGLAGRGLFAKVPIPKGTVLGCLTPGTPTVLLLDADGNVSYGQWESAQTIDLVVDNQRLICLVKDFGKDGPRGVDLLNHSCTPNCEVVARLVVKTVRDVQAGDELTIDYLASGITLVKEGIACLCRAGCPTVI